MLEQFLRHINHHKLFDPSDAIVVAVSGGLDSIVMLDLFKKAGFNIGVAHCNFQLRGEESDGDEIFVRHTCDAQHIPFYQTRFDTAKFANDKGVSIQMAARELRYRFFDEVMKQYNYKYTATAHHLNDSIETVFLNLVRGTGVDGLTGISEKVSSIIRPMLFATRDEVKRYAETNALKWREDSSNSIDKYHRNLLRNQVIPLLRQINPGLDDSFRNTLERLKGTADLQRQWLVNFKKEAVREHESTIYINKQMLFRQSYAEVVLWELIKEKGFNIDQCSAIVSQNHQAGKAFHAEKHIVTIDRSDIIVTQHVQQEYDEVEHHIRQDVQTTSWGGQMLHFERGEIQNFTLHKSAQIAQLDLDLIHFPLTWRRWREGDRFIPFGMKQYKKISDFLIDNKVPRPEKQHVTVLLSKGEIVWVTGLRIDDRFKITEHTKNFLLIHRDKSSLD